MRRVNHRNGEVEAKCARTYNFSSLYALRQLRMRSEDLPIGPIDLRDPKETQLLAEFGATPGKRIGHLLSWHDSVSLCTLAHHCANVTGPYRKELLGRSLNFILPRMNAPPPRTYSLQVPDELRETRTVLRRIMDLLISRTEKIEPQKAWCARFYARITQGKTRKLATQWLNEKSTSRQFTVEKVRSIPPSLLAALKDGAGTQISPYNWDVPGIPTTGEAADLITSELRRWTRHFHLPIIDEEITREVRRHVSGDSARWTWIQKSDVAKTAHFAEMQKAAFSDDTPRFDKEHRPFDWDIVRRMSIGRLDHNHHALLQRPVLTVWWLMDHYFMKDTTSFTVTQLTRAQLAQKFQLAYETMYPVRFRRPDVFFQEKDLPQGLIRGKQKCHAPSGLVCTKEGHIHDRLLVDTSSLPGRFMDHQLGKGWSLTLMMDPRSSYECYNIRFFGTTLLERHNTPVKVPEFADKCIKCGMDKEETVNGRVDCTSMFTNCDMSTGDEEAPKIQKRVAKHHGVNTITVRPSKQLRGQPGGAAWGNFQRRVFTFAELWDYWLYEGALGYFCLGDWKSTQILHQHRGCFMGGRLSRQKTSVILGKEEGLFRHSVRRQIQWGFWFFGYTLEQIFSMIRYVDDGVVASHVLCKKCITSLVGRLWPNLDVSWEEEGDAIRALDMLVMVRNGRFFIVPHNKAHTPLEPSSNIFVARYTPKSLCYNPVQYIKAMLIGRLSRVNQLMSGDGLHMYLAAMELFQELTSTVNRYSWEDCRRASLGLRLGWARNSLQQLRVTVKILAIAGRKS